jgi:GNAT superfamily N-acetyltransferase
LKLLLRAQHGARDESAEDELARSIVNEATSSPVEIRRLWPSDEEAFRDHLLGLGPRSRHLRFGGGMSDDFLIRYAENCFGKGDLIYGAFIDGKLVGAAELRSNQAIWSEQAPLGRHIHTEAAFSVEEGYRRRGIGEKLFKRVLRAATNHGVETIEIVCLPENVGMQNLVKKFHTHSPSGKNSLTGRLTARRPTALLLIREASGDELDLGAALFDAHWPAVAEAREKGA